MIIAYEKLLSFAWVFLMLGMNCCSNDPGNQRMQENFKTIYIGTYTSGESKGIYQCSFNQNTGKLSGLKLLAQNENPSFLTISPDKKTLYCVNETMEFNGKPGGALSSFKIDHKNDSLHFINEQLSNGGAPCHIITDKSGKFIFVSNYMGGNVSVYPIQIDGSIGEMSCLIQHKGSGKDSNRQEAPHAHSLILNPDDKFAYVSDLGIDKVMIYEVIPENGILTAANSPWANLEPGSGPRHFTFHPQGRYAYVINELNSSITAFSFNDLDGSLQEIQTISTLPVDFGGSNSCADIHISPSGKYLYGSNRGHNSIVSYSIDKKTGTLTLIDFESTLGETPRNFTLDSTGEYLLVANQDTNTIVTFRIDPQTGKLDFTENILSVPSPVCLKFLN
ncbi:MAG: lactonase family protein [Bacteroidales bacterium]|nr:lactonase family protein [Bacteroidales bacterium]